MAFLCSRVTDGSQIRWNPLTPADLVPVGVPSSPPQPISALVIGGYRSDRCESGIKQRSKSGRRIGPHRLRDVAVELEGGLNGIVPQALAHSVDVDAGFEK